MSRPFVLFLILTVGILQAATGQTNPPPMKKVAVTAFNTLVVRNAVSVILTENNNDDYVRIEGDDRFLAGVKAFQIGKTLIISGRNKKNLKRKGLIYIPVRGLQNLHVNAGARITSYNTLQSPLLNLIINGVCTVDIVVNGILNISESEGYDYTFTRAANNRQTFLKK